MKFFLLVLSSQALLCARVFSHSTANNDGQQSEPRKQVASSIDVFTLKLYNQLAPAHPKENLLFSPYSIAVAFHLASLGAKSETHQQILKGLSFDTSMISVEDITKGFQQLQKAINQYPSSITLNTSNACFVDKKLHLRQKFQDDLKLFQSEVLSTDFNKLQEAKDQINSYAEKKTNGRIKSIVDDLDPDTVLVIINAIYFNGTWQDIFNKFLTHKTYFYVDKEKRVEVQMMRREGQYPVASLDGLTMVEVPYKGNVSAFFIIPDEGKMEDVEKDFKNGSLREWIKKLKSMRIQVSIPRFLLSTAIDLKALLSQLGITDVFTDKADFSGITEDGPLKVSQARHKAVMTVDEEGTEAAAVTDIVFTLSSIPLLITADRPFIIIIRDKTIDVNLFIGRIMNPNE